MSSTTRNVALHCEVVTDFSKLESLASEWKRLFEDPTSGASVFQSWQWMKAFWRAYGTEVELCAPVVFADNRVVCFVPLISFGRKLRLMSDPYADYNGPLCRSDGGRAMFDLAFESLLRSSVPWTECVFNNLPESSPLLRYAGRSQLFADNLQAVSQYSCFRVLEDGSGVFERLSRKESLRRHENRLRRRGTLQFRHLEERQEIKEHLLPFFNQHIQRQAAVGVRSQFEDRGPRAMVEALVEELDPRHQIRFGVLELNGTAISYHLGFQHEGKLMWYLPTFDIRYRDDSPGEVLLRFLFKYAHAARLAEFDFTIGDESYKKRFANYVGQTLSVHFYRSPLRPKTQVLRAARFATHLTRGNPRALAAARLGKQVLKDPMKCLRKPIEMWDRVVRQITSDGVGRKRR